MHSNWRKNDWHLLSWYLLHLWFNPTTNAAQALKLLFLIEKIQNGLELQIRCFENPRFIVLIKIFKIQIYQKILSTVKF